MWIHDLLHMVDDRHASDLILTVGAPPILKIHKMLNWTDLDVITADSIRTFAREFFTDDHLEELRVQKELNFSYSVPGLARFRVNVFLQRGSIGVVFRRISSDILSFEQLNLPGPAMKYLSELKQGLVLVTGPMGCGKTTTLASMVEYINNYHTLHIITIEDPIEYLFKHKKSIIEQREVYQDTSSFSAALRTVMRQSPDIVSIGELHDLETISAALTVAETGVLVLGTLHAPNAVETINRIVDIFPAAQQQQIRFQLSSSLAGVISQQLIPRCDTEGLVVATEILVCLPNVKTMIRESNIHQILNVIETGSRFHMQTMDQSLINLYEKKQITKADLGLRLRDKNFNYEDKDKIKRDESF
jgi:twitching motility protein PilT